MIDAGSKLLKAGFAAPDQDPALVIPLSSDGSSVKFLPFMLKVSILLYFYGTCFLVSLQALYSLIISRNVEILSFHHI